MNALVVRNRPSNSAKALARALNTNVNALNKEPGRLAPKQYAALINWGCTRMPIAAGPGQAVINTPAAVALAACKLKTFTAFARAGVPSPLYWTPENAHLAQRKGAILMARTTTRGSGGDGIVVVREGDELPPAPLYTKYVPKESEYRVHVMRDKVVLIQQKRKDKEVDQTQNQKLIRNHANGWVFVVNNVTFKNEDEKARVVDASLAAIRSLGLDFGAVDLIVGKEDGKVYVLEVNTAPGLESPTLIAAYRDHFNALTGANDVAEQRGGVDRARTLPER